MTKRAKASVSLWCCSEVAGRGMALVGAGGGASLEGSGATRGGSSAEGGGVSLGGLGVTRGGPPVDDMTSVAGELERGCKVWF